MDPHLVNHVIRNYRGFMTETEGLVLKKKARELGLNVENKTMDSVINALEAKTFLKGAQAPIVSSYVKLRNAAIHAEWTKISATDVGSLLGFLEPFLLQHFS